MLYFHHPAPSLRARWAAFLRSSLASLKLRITLGAIAALMLGIGLTTAVLVQRAERDTLAAERQRELNEVVHSARDLSQRVVALQQALRVTAAGLDPAMLGDDARLAAFMQSQPVLRGMFANLFAASADGRMQMYADASSLRRPGLDLSDRDYFRRTLAERRAIVSEPMPGRISGEPIVVLTWPLIADGKVFGVFGGALRLASRDLLADLGETDNSDSQALIVVTDAQGRILAHPVRSRLLQPIATEPRLAHARIEWERSGSAIEPSGLHLAQAGEVVSAAGVAGPDWMIWRALPEAELLAPLRRARHQALAWALGLVGLISLVMFATVSWLLHPLRRLQHRAEHLFDGTQGPQAGWPVAGGEIGHLTHVLRHVVAERAQLEAFNTEVLRKLGSVMSSAPVGIAFTRAQRFELVSAEFCRLFGRSEEQLLGAPAQMIYASEADYRAIGPRVAEAFGAGQFYVGEWEMQRADGSRFWARLRGRAVDGGDPNAGTIWTINDIGDQKSEREALERSASHDALTGLPNRQAFNRRLASLFDAAPRALPAAVVMIDLDHFKPINDNAGHAAGDAMLMAVAAVIVSQVRTSDMAVRLGGDEFALLLDHCPQEVALRIAENVRAAIAAIALPWGQRVLRLGASLGVAPLTADTPDAAAWLAAADAACYEAKAAGRDEVRTAARPLLRVVGGDLTPRGISTFP